MQNDKLGSATVRFSASTGENSMQMNGVDLMVIEQGKIAEVYLFSADQDAEDRFWDTAKTHKP